MFESNMIDNFTLAYIECALWTSCDDNDEPLDASYAINDIEPESMEMIIRECKAFREDNKELLSQAYTLYNVKGYPLESMAGHDYWLTRNGHGAGFWDRGLDDIGDKLTEACEHQERNFFVNCDNKLDYQ